jgi:hypothetical protein
MHLPCCYGGVLEITRYIGEVASYDVTFMQHFVKFKELVMEHKQTAWWSHKLTFTLRREAKTRIIIIVTCMCDCRWGFGLEIGFIDHLQVITSYK